MKYFQLKKLTIFVYKAESADLQCNNICTFKLKISTSLQTIRYGIQYNYVDNTLKDQAITITTTITLKRRAQNNVNNNDNKILNKY